MDNPVCETYHQVQEARKSGRVLWLAGWLAELTNRYIRGNTIDPRPNYVLADT
jgi:hypothetical protein